MKKIAQILTLLVCLSFVACDRYSAVDKSKETEGDVSQEIPAKTIETESPSEETFPTVLDTTEENAWAKAYLDVINNLINQHGEGNIAANSFDEGESMRGVSVVRLIDFDGDGTYELYCGYSDKEDSGRYKQVIYGYEDGSLVLLKEGEVGNPGTDVSPSATFLTKNGKVYLVEVYEMVDGNYYTVQDKKMVSVLSYYYDAWEQREHSIDGVAMTDEDFSARLEEMEAGGTIEVIDFAYIESSSELIKTQDIIAEIASHI